MSIDAQICNATEMARILNVSERRVQQLAQQGILPKAARGQYALTETVQAFMAYQKTQSEQDDDDDIDYRRQKARLTKLQADEKAIQVAQLQATLISREDHDAEIATLITNAKQKLLALPQACSGQITPEMDSYEIQAILKKAIYDALNELARDDAAHPDSH